MATRMWLTASGAMQAFVLGLHDPEVLGADRSAVRVGDGLGLDALGFAVA